MLWLAALILGVAGQFGPGSIDCPMAAGQNTFNVQLLGQSQLEGWSTAAEQGGSWVNRTCCYRPLDNNYMRCVGPYVTQPSTESVWTAYDACTEATCGVATRERFGPVSQLAKLIVERSDRNVFIVPGAIGGTSMNYTLNANGPRMKNIDDCDLGVEVACGLFYQANFIDALTETGLTPDVCIFHAGEAANNATQNSQQNVSNFTVQTNNYTAVTNWITAAVAAGCPKALWIPVAVTASPTEPLVAIQRSQIRAATDHVNGCVGPTDVDDILREPLEPASNNTHYHNNGKFAEMLYDSLLECGVLTHSNSVYAGRWKPATTVTVPPVTDAGGDYTIVGAGNITLNGTCAETSLWEFKSGTAAGQDCVSASFADTADPDSALNGLIDGTASCEIRLTCSDGSNNTWDEAAVTVQTGTTALFGPSTWETGVGTGDAALRDTNLGNPWTTEDCDTPNACEVKTGGDCWDTNCMVFQSDCDGAAMNTPNLQEAGIMTLDVDDVNCVTREYKLLEFEKGWNNLHGEQSFPTVDWYLGSFRHDSTACDNLTTSESQIPCPTGENGFRNYFSNEVVNVVTGDFWCDSGVDCSDPANHKNGGLVRCSSPLLSHEDVWQRDDIVTVLDRTANRVKVDPKQYRIVGGVHTLVADSDDWDCTFSNNPMNKTLTEHLADGARLPWDETNQDFYLGNNGPLCGTSAALADHILYDNFAIYQGACPTP